MSAIKFLATRHVNRGIVRLTGRDTIPFLQTFLTNDLRHLIGGENGRLHCLYSHLPNSNGRTLVDLFIYKPNTESTEVSMNRSLVLAPFHVDEFGLGGRDTDQLLLECPKTKSPSLARLLFAMKIRKKIVVEEYNTNIWTLVPHDTSLAKEHHARLTETSSEDVIVSKDPRLDSLGFRIVSHLPHLKSLSSLANLLGLRDDEVKETTVSEYTKFRFRLGVSEGDVEHPEGFCYPLECNADFLNGLSFKKGMFCGDWIMGRNYRKGVKSRIMPVTFPDCDSRQLDLQRVVPWTELSLDGKVIGVIRNRVDSVGIASIDQRPLFNKCLKMKQFQGIELTHVLSGFPVMTWSPFWWQMDSRRRLPSSEIPVEVPLIPDGRIGTHKSLLVVKE